MSGAPPILLFGEAEYRLLSGVVADRALEVLASQHCAEHWTARLQYPTVAEPSHRDGVVADAVDECADRVYGVESVACNTQRPPIHRAGGLGVGLELVVADVVEGLDDS